MHRQRRWAALAALVTLAGSVTAGMPAAGADAGVTLYVNNTSTTCSDQGSGTMAVPYCTVQPAFSAVTAGETVDILAGYYSIPATLSASGTADAPITVWFGFPGAPFEQTSEPAFWGNTSPALTVANASYVDIDNIRIAGGSAPSVSVTGSSHVAFAGGLIGGGATGLAITDGSSDVSATRLTFASIGTAVSIGPGVTGTVIATDQISGEEGDGVDVDGASGTDIVGNGFTSCDSMVSVSGGATGTTIENNVIQPGYLAGPVFCASPVGLNVAADSVAGTTEKYDTIIGFNGTAVEWAGTSYSTADSYQAASGQGAQDLIRKGSPGEGPSDYVDNADALAPGETSTDFNGATRADDPYVANTGTGVGYYDRGPIEETDKFSARMTSVVPVNNTANEFAASWGYNSGWELCPKGYTITIDWGDGSSSTFTGTPCATASVKASEQSSRDDETCTYSQCGEGVHDYSKPGSYTVTFSATDGTVTTGNSWPVITSSADYFPYGPTRILDTRRGIGAPPVAVKQGSYVDLKVAGVGGIPADVTAVAVNLTETDATGNGYVAAEAGDQGAPTISNLNYLTGQTISNSAIVSVSPAGYVQLYNGGTGTGTADLIADVTGYFRRTVASGYAPVALSRILDTRKGIGAPTAQVAGGGSVPVQVAGVDSIPTSGVTAVAVHVTVTDTAGNGWIAAVPDGAAAPATSILNYRQGQTVSNTVIVPVAADGEVRLYNGGSTTPVDLIADVSGYFSADAPNAYEPLATATRVVDTRKAGSSALAPNSSNHYSISTYPHVAAIIGNLTVTQPTANGFITAFPDGSPMPSVSDVNFLQGQTVANLAILGTNPEEQPAAVNVYNSSNGTTELIIDVFGYFGS